MQRPWRAILFSKVSCTISPVARLIVTAGQKGGTCFHKSKFKTSQKKQNNMIQAEDQFKGIMHSSRVGLQKRNALLRPAAQMQIVVERAKMEGQRKKKALA